MTTIELTDEQRRVLRTELGRPVDVLDPATQQRYVLLAREQFEKMCSAQGGSLEQTRPAEPPALATREGSTLRQRVRDLPLPPKVAAEAKRSCKCLGFWGKQSLRQMEDQLKLQHYYGGMWIAELRTEEGPVVVACAENLSDPLFDRQLAFLTGEERRRVVLSSPPRLFDDENEVLTPFANEG